MSNIKLFKKIGNFVKETGKTRLVCISEFIDEYSPLQLGNGGSWCRFDNIKYKCFTIKNNGKIRFTKDFTDCEKQQIKHQYAELVQPKEKGNTIKYIKFCGYSKLNTGRPISQKIRDHFRNKSCVSCGTTSNIEVDHKNGLYNDIKVLQTLTQTIDDFQPLCRHCNQVKRESIKKMKETGVRPSALDIPILKIFNIDYTTGNEIYDENDPNWGIGTYWYDPIKFMEYIKNSLN
jgi:5-methylcytosine-specific restriction endonuclease McrA